MRVPDVYELPLNLPVIEPMRRRQQKPTSDRITPVTFCIQRKIDADNPANDELAAFLQDTDAANNAKRGKRKYPIKAIDGITTTYFGTLDLLAAVERQGGRGIFRNFGRDEKQTRDVMMKLKGSFMEYLRESRIIDSVMAESPLLEPLLENPFGMYGDGWTDVLPTYPFDETSKPSRWDDTPVKIGDTILALEGNNYVYVALDLSPNEFLTEERDGIRNHYRSEFGLNLLDGERWQDGKPLRHVMHSTVLKLSDAVFFTQPPEFGVPPSGAVFCSPEIEAHTTIGK